MDCPRGIAHKIKDVRSYSDGQARDAVNAGLRHIFGNATEQDLSPILQEKRMKLSELLWELLMKQREYYALEDEVGEAAGFPEVYGRTLRPILKSHGVSEAGVILMMKQSVDLMATPSFNDTVWQELGIGSRDRKLIIEACYLCRAADVDPCVGTRAGHPPHKSVTDMKTEKLKGQHKHVGPAPNLNPFASIGPELPLFYDEEKEADIKREARIQAIRKEMENLQTCNGSQGTSDMHVYADGGGPDIVLQQSRNTGDIGELKTEDRTLIPWTMWNWNTYYLNNREPFEKLIRYKGALRKYLRENLNPSDKILVVGSGLSEVSTGLYSDGFFFIDNIDFSEAVVNLMAERTRKKYRKMTWRALDACDMHDIQNKTYDAVVDKGMVDSMLIGSLDLMPRDVERCVGDRVARALREIYRVLRPGGYFYQFSAQNPELRMSWLSGARPEASLERDGEKQEGWAQAYQDDITQAPLQWIAVTDSLPDSLPKRGFGQLSKSETIKEDSSKPYVYKCQKPRLLGSVVLPTEVLTQGHIQRTPMDLRSEDEIQKHPMGPENLPTPRAYYDPPRPAGYEGM